MVFFIFWFISGFIITHNSGKNDELSFLIYYSNNLPHSLNVDKIQKAVRLGVTWTNSTSNVVVKTSKYPSNYAFLQTLMGILKQNSSGAISDTLLLFDPEEFHINNLLAFKVYLGMFDYTKKQNSDKEKAFHVNILSFSPTNIFSYIIEFLKENKNEPIGVFFPAKNGRNTAEIKNNPDAKISFIETFSNSNHSKFLFVTDFVNCLKKIPPIFKNQTTYICFSYDLLKMEVNFAKNQFRDFNSHVIRTVNNVLSDISIDLRYQIVKNLLVVIPRVDFLQNLKNVPFLDKNSRIRVEDVLFLCDISLIVSYLTAAKTDRLSADILTNTPCSRKYFIDESNILPYFDIWSLNNKSLIRETFLEKLGRKGSCLSQVIKYQNENIASSFIKNIMIIMFIIINIILVFLFFVYFDILDLSSLYPTLKYTWLVEKSDIFLGEAGSVGNQFSESDEYGYDPYILPTTETTNTKGYFDGKQIFVNFYKLKSKDLSYKNTVLNELEKISKVQQKNLNVFVGAFLQNDHIGIMTHHYIKSSLYDLLIIEANNVTDLILISIINDLVNALDYLHRSDIKYHGNLTSKSCFVDGRWVLKIKEFGLHALRRNEFEDITCTFGSESCSQCSKLLWKSPEYLNRPLKSVSEYQKNDIFSFGVILNECFTNKGPWSSLDTDPCLIIRQLKFNYKSLRNNTLNEFDWFEYKLYDIMINCLTENPKYRWDIVKVRKKLKICMHENSIKPNLIDNLINAMSYHTKSLEKEVKSKALEIEKEKSLTDKLVERILPKEIASQLANGYPVEPELYEQVTLFLGDIVGFTAMTSSMSPIEVVKFLNPIYTIFDTVVDKYDVYKVETIGDAYMVASGVPQRNGDLHVFNICRMAWELLTEISKFPPAKINSTEQKIKLRIGIHTGPIVAGVVGKKMPRYCLFGESVQIIHKLEQTSEEMKIQISESTYNIIKNSNEFETEAAKEIELTEGRKINTYWIKKR